MLLRPLPRMGWRRGGDMRGERKQVEWLSIVARMRAGFEKRDLFLGFDLKCRAWFRSRWICWFPSPLYIF
jgi:hypothetical protein